MIHRRVSTSFDEVGVHLVSQFVREFVGRGAAAGRPEELHLDEILVLQLIFQLFRDSTESALADPDGYVQIVCLLPQLLFVHSTAQFSAIAFKAYIQRIGECEGEIITHPLAGFNTFVSHDS